MMRSHKRAFAALITFAVYVGLIISGAACAGICFAVDASDKGEDHSRECSHTADHVPSDNKSQCSGMGHDVTLACCGCNCSYSGPNLYLQTTLTPEVFAPAHTVAECCEIASLETDDSDHMSLVFQPLRFLYLQNLKSVLLLI